MEGGHSRSGRFFGVTCFPNNTSKSNFIISNNMCLSDTKATAVSLANQANKMTLSSGETSCGSLNTQLSLGWLFKQQSLSLQHYPQNVQVLSSHCIDHYLCQCNRLIVMIAPEASFIPSDTPVLRGSNEHMMAMFYVLCNARIAVISNMKPWHIQAPISSIFGRS